MYDFIFVPLLQDSDMLSGKRLYESLSAKNQIKVRSYILQFIISILLTRNHAELEVLTTDQPNPLDRKRQYLLWFMPSTTHLLVCTLPTILLRLTLPRLLAFRRRWQGEYCIFLH